jgi:hypothetical protein
MGTSVRSPLSKSRRQESPALSDLARADGPPLTTSELAQIVGMSSTFIRSEIKHGALSALSIGRGRKHVFRIPVAEAARYLRQLGFL